MNKYFLAAGLAFCAAQANAGTVTVVQSFGDFDASGSLDVVETIETGMFGEEIGVYDVTNNTGGALMGFGVSNDYTFPVVFPDAPEFTVLDSDAPVSNRMVGPFASDEGCTMVSTYLTCYSTRELNAGNWNEEVAHTEFLFAEEQIVDYTFQDIFGDFSAASGGDTTFNWYDFSIEEIFFPREELRLFEVSDLEVEMVYDYNINPLLDGDSVEDYFGFFGNIPRSSIIGQSSNGQGGTSFFTAGSAVVPAVPLPAAAWMLIAGIGGLGAVARRKNA